MITRKMIPEYLKYILPTMLTFTLGGIYSIVDGIFVGHAVGDAGLAGHQRGLPACLPYSGRGHGLGMGGGVISSIARGEGNSARATRVIGVTLFMLFAVSIPILVLYILLAEQLCSSRLAGQGETLVQAVHYLQVIGRRRAVSGARHRLHAAYPQPRAGGLRHGGAAACRRHQRRARLRVRHAVGTRHGRRRRGHGGGANRGVSVRAGVFRSP